MRLCCVPMNNKNLNSHTHFLRDELAKRLQKNSRYSMRAFADLLGINIGTLSGLLSGKRPLTPKMSNFLFDRLGTEPSARENILGGVVATKRNRPKLTLSGQIPERIEVGEESFRAISDWQHYAILQIVKTQQYLEGAKPKNTKWIARQLGISELDAKLAIGRLTYLGLLKVKEGYLCRTEKRLTTANKNLTSAALKKLQRQVREKAIYSLEHDPIEVRSMTSMTMAISPQKMGEAKTLIDEFQERLADLLEKDQKQKVYQLEISLFPLQIREN